MLVHEWLALGFFAHLAVAAVVLRLPRRRRAVAGLGAIAMAAAVVVVARLQLPMVRSWAPVAYMLVGYYLAGQTFFRPMPHIEEWLIGIDRTVLGDHRARFAAWPRTAVALLDAAYIGCFLLVPAGLALLLWAGRAELTEQYWTIVLGAELGAFATLPYLQTRPPWVIERLADSQGPRASVLFMKHATTGANTLPSGHAAGSLAVALAVADALPEAGSILIALALAIAVATIVTRAHFVVDVVTGVALAVAIWLAARIALT